MGAMLVTRLLPLALFGFLTGGATLPAMQASLPPSAGSVTAAHIASLLPQSGQVVQIMKLGSRLTVVDLQERVMAAGGSREALQKVLAVISGGGVPTYDERLGITRAEFRKYIAFQPILVGTGKVLKIPLTNDGTRLTFGDAPGLNGLFKGVSFDLKTGDLRVPEGFVARPQAVNPSSAPDRTVDIRGGFLWNLKAYNASTRSGINGQMQLFQLASGQVILGYRRTSILKDVVNEGELLLSYQR